MDKKMSLYLDLLRVMATFAVFIGHFAYKQFSGEYFGELGEYSHDAVIVFFVLSGYVIAYISNEKETDLKSYLSSRFARVYSVLLPALILTIGLDKIGAKLSMSNYVNYNFDDITNRFLINLFYLQEMWNTSIRFMSNGVIWSLGYEMWYYIVFGLLFYKRKNISVKISIVILIILFYKIAMLFPIWLLGALAYYINKQEKWKLNKIYSYSLFTLTLISFYILKNNGILVHYRFDELGFSQYIIGDYITGILLFINILSIRNIKLPLERLSSIIKKLANFSFSIYLFHFPILVFFISVFQYKKNNIYSVISVACIVLVICYVLSLFTENKKYLYKKIFVKLLNLKVFRDKQSAKI